VAAGADVCIALISAFWIVVYVGGWIASGFAGPALGIRVWLPLCGYYTIFGLSAVSIIAVVSESERTTNRHKADNQRARWLARAKRSVAERQYLKKTASGIQNVETQWGTKSEQSCGPDAP
jgi:hypothetical protein